MSKTKTHVCDKGQTNLENYFARSIEAEIIEDMRNDVRVLRLALLRAKGPLSLICQAQIDAAQRLLMRAERNFALLPRRYPQEQTPPETPALKLVLRKVYAFS